MWGRKVAVLSLLVVMLVSLVGCGGNTPAPPENQSAQMDQLKSTLFVDANWLKANLSDVVVIDARPEKDYNSGHIPGAVSAVWQSFTSMEGKKPGDPGWGVLLPKEQLAAKIGQLGVSGDKPVIVYAQPPGWGEDGRILWMLKMAGIKDVKILDGGLAAWKAINDEISKDKVQPAPVKFEIASLDESMNATTDWIISNQKNIKIVDSRSSKEYGGATDYGEVRGGHLPGAISLPFENMFNQDGTLKSSDEIKQLFTAAGLNLDDEIVTYCTAGIRSAHMSQVMRMVGFTKARNYDASYHEWAGNQSLTVER
ncbi:MAG: sulfurtransferase [Bacillota bacterium]|jgi:thiosulfate/3-mercaptopyruvate sulfurtransferase